MPLPIHAGSTSSLSGNVRGNPRQNERLPVSGESFPLPWLVLNGAQVSRGYFYIRKFFFLLGTQGFSRGGFLCFPWGKLWGQKSLWPWYSRGQPWGIFVSHAIKKPGKGRSRGFLLRPSKVNDKRERGGDILKTGCSLCKRKGAGE